MSRNTVRNRDTQETAETRAFAESVSGYSAAELYNTEKEKKASPLPGLLARFAVIAVCIAVLGYSVYMIADKLISDYRAEAAYDDIRVDEDGYISVRHAQDLQEPNGMPTVLQMLSADGEYEDYVPSDYVPEDKMAHYTGVYKNFMKLSAKYPEMYAWIYMTDTKINYPVMKGSNNSFYLSHNYKGETSNAGSIFADCHLSDSVYSNRNVLIYGHNMRGNLMFHSLKTWCEDDKNKTMMKTSQIEIYTKEGVYIYDMFAWYIDGGVEYTALTFRDESDYLKFLKTAYSKSKVKSGREYGTDSRVCTLVTCTNGTATNFRYVVHGILNRFMPFS